MAGPAIVLIGAPGSGKTTVGTALAGVLGVPFRDTDADVESATGMTVAQVFVDEGESRFRELEREAVIVALAEHDGVLALGGGAILDLRTRADLRGQRTCWLRVGLADAASRVGLGVSRPLLLGNVRGTLMRLLDERAPLYSESASVTVDTDGRAVDDIVSDIRAWLEAQS